MIVHTPLQEFSAFDHLAHARRVYDRESALEQAQAAAQDFETRLREYEWVVAKARPFARALTASSSLSDPILVKCHRTELADAITGAERDLAEARAEVHTALDSHLRVTSDEYRIYALARRLYGEIQSDLRAYACALRALAGHADAALGAPVEAEGALAFRLWYGSCVPADILATRLRERCALYRGVVAGTVFSSVFLPDFASVVEGTRCGPCSADEKRRLCLAHHGAVTALIVRLPEAERRVTRYLGELDAALLSCREHFHAEALVEAQAEAA